MKGESEEELYADIVEIRTPHVLKSTLVQSEEFTGKT